MSQVRVQGTIVREEFGPGAYLLETPEGRRYALAKLAPELRVEGQRVEVVGRIRSDLLGGAMTGDQVLEVQSFTLA